MHVTETPKPAFAFPGPQETRPSLLPKLRVKPWIQDAPSGHILINAKVVDAASGKLLEGLQTVVIVEGSIVEVGAKVEREKYGGLPVVDVKEYFVCPGLIDGHVHVTAVPGASDMRELIFHTPDELLHLRQSYVLKEMIKRGFTTVRDCGGATKSLANAIEEGLIEGPRLIQAGKALSQTGGHGDFSSAIKRGGGEASNPGCCGGHSLSLGRVADGVPDCLRAVREELMAGADFIKVMVGGGVLSETDAIESVQYTPEELQAITRTAKVMGNRHVTAHAYTNEAVHHAVSNGVMGIEHGNLINEDTARMMAEKGVYLTPTLSAYGIMTREPFQNFLPPSGQKKNREVMQSGLKAIKMADEMGVTVCYGSDLLLSMHALQTEEFAVRAEILPSPNILRHATINPAKMVGMEGKLGVIKAGAIADIIFLTANPLEDITVLDRPEDHLKGVMKSGRVVFSSVTGL